MRISATGLLYEDTDRASAGYLLIAPVEGDAVFLLDPAGQVAHCWQTGGGMTNWSYLLPNGHLFTNERCAEPKGVSLTVSGRMVEYDAAGQIVWTHEDPYQHHDARRLADGAVYAAFTEFTEAEKAAVKGGAPWADIEGGPFGEVIRQVDETGRTVWEWHFSSMGMAEFPLHANAARWSYGHTNTVCPLKDGRYLICSKTMNMLFIVNPATDQVEWRYQNQEMGGPHDAQMLDNGHILIFANGLYAQDLHHSQIWQIDPASNEIVWRYKAKDNMTSFFSPHMGGVQRLPNGNTLICEGSKGCIFEVTDEGDIVREFVSPHFVQSESFGKHNWLFRARWYEAGSAEITALLGNR